MDLFLKAKKRSSSDGPRSGALKCSAKVDLFKPTKKLTRAPEDSDYNVESAKSMVASAGIASGQEQCSIDRTVGIPTSTLALSAEKGNHQWMFFNVTQGSGVYESLRQFSHELDKIPDFEKSAYIEACQTIPMILYRESNPEIFLRFRCENVAAAALLFAQHWQVRKNVFGERAFLPMNSTGEGTLSPTDLLLYRTHYLVALPNNQDGCSVQFFEPGVLASFTPARLRCVFYTQFLAMHNTNNAKDGYTILTYMDERGFDGIFGRETPASLLKAMPVRLGALLLFHTLTGDEMHVFERCVPQLTRLYSCPVKTFSLATCTKEEIGDFFQIRALKPEALPVKVGGALSQADVINLDKARTQMEWQAHAELAHSDLLNLADTDKVFQSKTKGHDLLNVPQRPKSWIFQTQLDHCNSTALDAFAKALREIPQSEKSSFLEALESAPDLLHRETHPRIFLQFEANDPLAAARRFVSHWQTRQRLFGDRAFLPMNTTGDGALSSDDIELLSSTYITLLEKDNVGRDVIFYTPELAGAESTERLKCGFYTLTRIMQNEKTVENGAVVIALLGQTEMGQAAGRSGVAEMLRRSIPIRFKRVHIIHCLSGFEEQVFEKRVLPSVLGLFGCQVLAHDANAPSEVLATLVACGLKEEHLPDLIGGKMSFADIVALNDNRRGQERADITGLLSGVGEPGEVHVADDLSLNGGFDHENGDPHFRDEMIVINPKETQEVRDWEQRNGAIVSSSGEVEVNEENLHFLKGENRKRILNVIASRRKRLRRKERYESLEKFCNDLCARKAAMQEANARLEELLRKASGVVAAYKMSMRTSMSSSFPLDTYTLSTMGYGAHALHGSVMFSPHGMPIPVTNGLIEEQLWRRFMDGQLVTQAAANEANHNASVAQRHMLPMFLRPSDRGARPYGSLPVGPNLCGDLRDIAGRALTANSLRDGLTAWEIGGALDATHKDRLYAELDRKVLRKPD